MDNDIKELLDLVKNRSLMIQDILKTMKNNSRNLNASNRVDLTFVLSHLHALNVMIDKEYRDRKVNQ